MPLSKKSLSEGQGARLPGSILVLSRPSQDSYVNDGALKASRGKLSAVRPESPSCGASDLCVHRAIRVSSRDHAQKQCFRPF